MLPTADQLLRNGYILIGFVDGNGRQYAPGYIFTMPGSSIRLMALWAPITYIISFDKNDDVATGTASDQRYEYASPGTRLDDVAFERRNAKLLGWAFSPDAVVPDFTAGQLMEALLETGVLGLVRGGTIDDPTAAMYLLAAMVGNGNNAIKLYAIWDSSPRLTISATLSPKASTQAAKSRLIRTALNLASRFRPTTC